VEGLVLTIALLVALGIAVGIVPLRRRRRRVEPAPPPGRSAPDDWPRDGGDNPSAP
jgi:hypothetical protein